MDKLTLVMSPADESAIENLGMTVAFVEPGNSGLKLAGIPVEINTLLPEGVILLRKSKHVAD